MESRAFFLAFYFCNIPCLPSVSNSFSKQGCQAGGKRTQDRRPFTSSSSFTNEELESTFDRSVNRTYAKDVSVQ